MSEPRVLFVTECLDRGGAERHLASLLPDLRKHGLAAELFVLKRGGELEADVVAAGVPVHGVQGVGGGWAHLASSAAALFRTLRTKRPDIVHFFLPRPYLLGSAVAMAAGSSLRFMSRRSLTHYHRHHPWLARFERLLHRRTKVLLGNSQAVVDELNAETGKRKRIGLIHSGVAIGLEPDAAARGAARKMLGISNDAFVAAIVANLIGYKGHADLLEGLGAVASRMPQPWHLLVIGRDEGIGGELQTQATRLGLDKHIMWLGERRDVQALWGAADLGLLASHQEGFSNALIEAMSAGVPVVATAIGGNLDAVANGECGRLVPVSDSRAMGEAIVALAQDTTLRQTMGRRARERVETLFSQGACVERYLRLYRNVAALRSASVQSIIDGALSPAKSS
jgi:glycosyltransferase involved in cell wall biosynthesis